MKKKNSSVVRLGGLNTNADKLVSLSVLGQIVPPKFGQNPYRIQAKTGQAIALPGVGGICFNKRIGDSCIDLVGDHIEPGASIAYPDRSDSGLSANNGLNVLSCIGNPVRVLTGDAKGEWGRVTGKHGGIEHVLVDFPSEILQKLAVGDSMQVYSFGLGLEFIDYPDIHVMNLDPMMVKIMHLKSDKSGFLHVPVTHKIPGKIMGSGLGKNNVYQGDYDIQLFDEKTVEEYQLMNLRFGDIVAIEDVDHSYGRIWHSGSISVGVVIHSNSVVAGHGPGFTTILTSLKGKVKPIISKSASLANYFQELSFPT